MARPRKYGYDCSRISLYLAKDKIAILNKLCLKKGMNRNELAAYLLNKEYHSEECTIEQAEKILNESKEASCN